jgi:hypothetical protein
VHHLAQSKLKPWKEQSSPLLWLHDHSELFSAKAARAQSCVWGGQTYASESWNFCIVFHKTQQITIYFAVFELGRSDLFEVHTDRCYI